MIELRVLSGARAGHRETFDKSVVALGRHPLSDLRFDPDADRDVSSRHAEVRTANGRAVIVDVNSTNGTWVNGLRLQGERELRTGDVISCGEHGPRVAVDMPNAATFGVNPEDTPHTRLNAPAIARAASGPALEPRSTTATGHAPRDTSERIAVAVRESTRGLRQLLIAASLLMVLSAGAAFWMSARKSSESEARTSAFLARLDSLEVRNRESAQRFAMALGTAPQAAPPDQRELDRLRRELRENSSGGVERLGAEVERMERRSQQISTAMQQADHQSINSRYAPSVIFLAVQMPGGALSSGTGFAVSRDGMLVTNRHLVQDERGGRAERVAVAFNGARGWRSARIIKVSTTDDLAFLRVDGPIPAVAGIARSDDASQVGAPVTVIGYPLGADTKGMDDGSIDSLVPLSTLTVGTVSKTLPDVLQIDSYAGQGSSGSPVFDRNGMVIGVVYGGASGSGGRIVYAVARERLAAQLPN